MRCGNVLVNKGDPQAKVLKHCGEPAGKTRSYGIRSGTYPELNSGISGYGETVTSRGRVYLYGQTEVLLEDWTYNLGPDKFMRLIRFANGIVEEIKTLDYGYLEDS
jgi:hypothetical protein